MDTSLGIEKIENDDVALFLISGVIDVYSVSDFKNALIKSIATHHTRIVIDFSELDFIDSTGLGVLVSAIKRERAVRGRLVLVIKSDNIKRIFEITSLDRIISIYETIEDAFEDLEPIASKVGL